MTRTVAISIAQPCNVNIASGRRQPSPAHPSPAQRSQSRLRPSAPLSPAQLRITITMTIRMTTATGMTTTKTIKIVTVQPSPVISISPRAVGSPIKPSPTMSIPCARWQPSPAHPVISISPPTIGSQAQRSNVNIASGRRRRSAKPSTR